MIKGMSDIQKADIEELGLTDEELANLIIDLGRLYEDLSIAEFLNMEYGINP